MVLTRPSAFLTTGAGLLAAGLVAVSAVRWPAIERATAAELTARPPAGLPGPPGPLAAPGTHRLGLTAVRDALLRVPPGLPAGAPAPLVVVLHGAGADAAAGLGLLADVADERGLLLLAPASRAPTWDAIFDDFGPDAALIDRALHAVFAALPVDPARVALAGFSDGGSYALGLGLANGDLFRRLIAFSPGFVPPGPRNGRPAVFVSHGDADPVLPVERTGRPVAQGLRSEGYDVTYREFAGGHEVPPDVAREAVDWLDRGPERLRPGA